MITGIALASLSTTELMMSSQQLLSAAFSEHKAHKNEIQMLEKTPVSLLYGAYKKK
ncbi:hypothetical protein K6O88_000504 [Salmonella enterica]|nr:hypothetical protein [Salmonella enterica]